MKRKTKLYLLLTISLCAILIVVFYNFINLKKLYIVVFHKNGVISHFNSNGQVVGGVDIYLNGKIVQTANVKNGIFDSWKAEYYPNGNVKSISFYNEGKLDGVEFNYYNDGKIKSKESFKHGKREGAKITYFQNGQIQQRLSRKNDKDEGVEHAYYKNGKLQYIRNWANDKLYGNQYFYYESGKVQIYHAYDILGDKFYISHYDSYGKRSQSDGYEFSSNTYSRDTTCDSLLLLENKKSYRTIRDFYITIANPPDSSMTVRIIINNKPVKHLTFIDDNTAKVPNAFPKRGVYHISVDVAYVGKSNMHGDGTNGKLIIIKE